MLESSRLEEGLLSKSSSTENLEPNERDEKKEQSSISSALPVGEGNLPQQSPITTLIVGEGAALGYNLSPSSPSLPSLTTIFDDLITTVPPFAKNPLPEIVLSIAALLSMVLYLKPSWLAGMKQGGVPLAVLQEIGNTGSAAYVAINVGGHYIGLLKAAKDATGFLKRQGLLNKKISKSINAALDEAERCGQSCPKKAWDYLKRSQLHILLIAALTAVSLGAAAAFYRDWEGEPDVVLWLKVVASFSVYTFIHTLPVALILNVPALNFLLIKVPTFPYQLIKCAVVSCCLNKENRVQRMLDQKSADNGAQLIRHLSAFFGSMEEKLKQSVFEKKGLLKWKLNNIHSPQNFAELLQLIGNLQGESTGTNLQPSQITSDWRGKLYSVARTTASVVGAFLASFGLAGFIKATWYVLYEKILAKSIAGTIPLFIISTVPPLVLTSYFGRQAFNDIYDYLYALYLRHPPTPFSFKLSPATYSACLSATLFMDCFGYGTALQLFDDTAGTIISDASSLQFLRTMVVIGLVAYGLPNAAQFSDKLVEPLVARFGSDDKKELIKILRLLRRTSAFFEHLDALALKQLAENTDSKDLQILGLVKDPESHEVHVSPTTVDSVSHLRMPRAKPAEGCCAKLSSFLGGFFSGHRGGSQATSTLLPPGGINYSSAGDHGDDVFGSALSAFPGV